MSKDEYTSNIVFVHPPIVKHLSHHTQSLHYYVSHKINLGQKWIIIRKTVFISFTSVKVGMRSLAHSWEARNFNRKSLENIIYKDSTLFGTPKTMKSWIPEHLVRFHASKRPKNYVDDINSSIPCLIIWAVAIKFYTLQKCE